MKLGLAIEWAGAEVAVPVARVQLAERLGFDSVWSAEAYGQDAFTPLAFLAAHTRRIRLGTAVVQVAARTPAATAMAAQTLEGLAGRGRVVLGLGLSGPQIVEGWYGQPWGRPARRLRDTVAILRKVFAREAPVRHEGAEISLPYTGPGALGLGKPLRSILHTNPALPIWLGTGSQAMVTLTAEIADGWLPFGFAPGMLPTYLPWLEEGFRRAGGGKSLARFEIQAGCHVTVTDDVEAGLARQKPMTALYVGGMGHKDVNFHKDMMARRGYPEAAARIQELFLAGRREEAVAAVPDEYLDEGGLVGPLPRIRERFGRWLDSGATGLTIFSERDDVLELMADLAGTRAGSSASS
ncbi:MAG TPA: LLM class F420-dependent oxidoreductase [Myxococcota bacterium]|jgi:F420-dependent oxidoreductase-like protein|nr:LLM class F420-dependent oxidoreductase [Myxococcota bacterium]